MSNPERAEAPENNERETTGVEKLGIRCILCDGKFIVRRSNSGTYNVAVPVGGTPNKCPKSLNGEHRLNLITL